MPSPTPTPVVIPFKLGPAIEQRPGGATSVRADRTPVTPAALAATPSGTLSAAPDANKRLILTASQDSFVRVISQDTPDADKPLYASVLHTGQSIAFDGRKFSINVGVPFGRRYQNLTASITARIATRKPPETFTVESHQP